MKHEDERMVTGKEGRISRGKDWFSGRKGKDGKIGWWGKAWKRSGKALRS